MGKMSTFALIKPEANSDLFVQACSVETDALIAFDVKLVVAVRLALSCPQTPVTDGTNSILNKDRQ